jgi:hypothetical protein
MSIIDPTAPAVTRTVHSTTGTAPVTFTAVEPAGTVRIDLADGSSQVYDTRAVSRALSEATAAPDVLGYGPALGFGPARYPDGTLPAWATLTTPWERLDGNVRARTRTVRRTFGDGSVAVDAVQDLTGSGQTTTGPAEVCVNVERGEIVITDPDQARNVAASLLEAAALLEACTIGIPELHAPNALHGGPAWTATPTTGGYRSAQVSVGHEESGAVVNLDAPRLALSAEDARRTGHELLAAAYRVDDLHAGVR